MFGEKRFEEGQAFPIFVYPLLLLGCVAMLLPPHHWSLVAVPLVIMLCAGNLLYMSTRVTGRTIRVRFGALVPFYVRTIDVGEIEGVEAGRYSPLAEYGGWGIRGMGSNMALNARGNLGVRLHLTRGRILMIGTQRPEELADAIRQAQAS